MKKISIYTLVLVLVSSCSEYGQVVKKGTNDEKYDMAKKLYEKKDYVRALPLLEDLLAVYRGKEKSEEIYYYYCYCYFGIGQYELAAFHFNSFTENFYNSKHIEQCRFYYAHCLYMDAQEYFLDQTSTYKAIAEVQLYLNQFPNSKLVYSVDSSKYIVKNGIRENVRDTVTYKEQSNLQIEELRNKLKTKAFENAMLFYKIEDYLAAIVSLKNALKDFPDMENKDQIEFMIVKASYFYAKYSIDEKKEERYKNVFAEYKEFTKNNKLDNKWYAEATNYNEKAIEELNKHQKLHNIQK